MSEALTAREKQRLEELAEDNDAVAAYLAAIEEVENEQE